MLAWRALLACVAASLLGGCATAQLDQLKPVAAPSGMWVQAPIQWVLGSSAMLASGSEVGLLPGYYLATKENANGTFYLGPGQCLIAFGTTPGHYQLLVGGVWWPKNAENPTRLFSVVGEPGVVVSTLEEAQTKCRQPQAKDAAVGMTQADLTSVLVSNPQALGVKPAGVNGALSGAQVAGGVVAAVLVQAIVDSAKGEYQVLQKVEDPVALGKMAAAITAARDVAAKR